jgi:hypothetical protein
MQERKLIIPEKRITVRLRGSATHRGHVHSSVDDLEGVSLSGD